MREYFFRYVLLRKGRVKAAALRFGTLFHVALNAWWGCNGDALEKLVAAWRAIDAQEGECDPFEIIKAKCLILGYTARWGNEGYETLAVELQFRLEVGAFDIGGAIDAVVKRGGRVRNVEHKTTSSDISVGSDYWRHVVALDPQVSTYMFAAHALGYEPVDTLYDVVRKPTIVPFVATPEDLRKYTRPTKAEPIPRLYANQRETDETPEEFGDRLIEDIIARPAFYFQRMPIVRLDNDNEEHAKDVHGTAAMIEFATERGVWPRTPTACERFGRLCEYHDVCSGITTIDDNSRFVTKEYPHEELKT